jgi:hypothetical protein
MKHLSFLPTPRHIVNRPGFNRIIPGGRISLAGAPAQDLLFAGKSLARALREDAGVSWEIDARPSAGSAAGSGGVVIQAGARSVRNPEGYELGISRDGILVRSRTAAGALQGVRTLAQVIRQCGRRLPCLAITDEPDFPRRGVMLDVSRDKVPTLKTLFDLIELLGSWKINEVQLYTEHTFAYRNHRDVWAKASPLTGQDILELDRFCRTRGIDLVPNQNSFGHMHRWLTIPRYRDMAEAPNGCDTDWGRFKEPFSLNPTDPRSLALIREMFDELLPHFSSGQFNVGCDETMDLGKDRNKKLADRIGVGRIYLDFLKKIHREVTARGHVMQFWGDIILKHPKLVSQLPRDAVALSWGYEYDHGFAKECRTFKKAGLKFYVCPGTSTWTTILGRTDNAIGNIKNAAENGHAHGAIGILNTDWGDQGHWQYLPVSYLGYAYGAATGWSVKANRDASKLPRALDLFCFRDRAGVMGRLAYDLGNVYNTLGPRYFNASGLVRAMLTGNIADLKKHKEQKPEGYRRALRAIAKAVSPLAKAHMDRDDAELIKREFASGAALSRHAARRALLAYEENVGRASREKKALAADLKALIREYRELWHARNRPGGFVDSVRRLENAGKAYR